MNEEGYLGAQKEAVSRATSLVAAYDERETIMMIMAVVFSALIRIGDDPSLSKEPAAGVSHLIGCPGVPGWRHLQLYFDYSVTI